MNIRDVARLSTGLLAASLALAGCDRLRPGNGGSGQSAAGGSTSASPQNGPLVVDGYEVITARQATGGPTPSDPMEERRRREREQYVLEPTSPDPEAGDFTLEEAVADLGLSTDGTLVAEIGTDLGVMYCDLHADRVPRTVANFIGLARGTRAWWDAKSAAWVRRPYYRGLSFHRVIPDYLVQAGDYLEIGRDAIGYTIPTEGAADVLHDRAGLLCMATEVPQGGGPGRNAAQFFVTDGPTHDLDGSSNYTVFGRCLQPEVANHIARVPQSGRPENRPLTPVVLNRVVVRRVRGGAVNAAPPRTPVAPEVSPTGQPVPRGASPPPGAPFGGLPGPGDPHQH